VLIDFPCAAEELLPAHCTIPIIHAVRLLLLLLLLLNNTQLP
jgi:hypothetical protein